MCRNEYLIARSATNGMEIYAVRGGREHFLMQHRYNSRLFAYLNQGKSLDEIRSFNPGRNRGNQKMRNSLSYLLKVNDCVKYELAA